MARLLALLLTVLAGLASAGPAWAHASLLHSDPAGGAMLAAGPQSARLTFNEPVSPLVFRLIGPGGETRELPGAASQDGIVTLPLPPALPRGTHLLSWRVVSADGHPAGGAFVFSIGERSAMPQANGAVPDLATQGAVWIVRLVLYGGLFFGIGGAFYRAFPGGGAISRADGFVTGALIAGALAAMLSVGTQGLDALARPLSGIFDAQVWQAGLATTYRSTAQIATFAMLAALFSMQAARVPLSRATALLALIGAGAALAASGHAANAAPQALMRGAIFVHAVCAAFWIGALLPLIAALDDTGRIGLRRFTRAIPVVLVALIAAGIVIAVVQVEKVEALWTTAYGRVLTAKLFLVSLLLGLGALNRFRLVPALERGRPDAANALRRAIAIEIALAVAILGLVAVWRFTPPPRTLSSAIAQPIEFHIHHDRAMANIVLRARPDGRRAATIDLLDGAFGPLPAREVTLVLSRPESGIEPLRFPARPDAGTSWRIETVDLPGGGRWRAAVEILVSDFEKLTIDDTIELPQ